MDNLLKQLDRRQLSLIGGGILALLAIALLTYVVQPRFKEFRAARASFTLLQATSETDAGLNAQLTTLRTHVDVLERAFHGDMANLPLKQMEAFIIGRLQGISWSTDVQFMGVQPEDGGLSGQFSELLFNVELQGRYFDIFDWLEAVREQLGFVVIKQFEITPVGPTGVAEPQLQVNLTMASYRWVEA